METKCVFIVFKLPAVRWGRDAGGADCGAVGLLGVVQAGHAANGNGNTTIWKMAPALPAANNNGHLQLKTGHNTVNGIFFSPGA